MPIWSAEIKEIQVLFDSIRGQFPDLEKELKPLVTSEDSNVVLLYSRRCLEVIVTELCEVELKRPRKTEPLKGIIDKLNSEEKVPSNIITSMHGLNSLSTFGTHPKDFEQEQVKPVLNNLAIVLRWYFKYKETQSKVDVPPGSQKEVDRTSAPVIGKTQSKTKKILISSFTILLVAAAVLVVIKFIVLNREVEKSIAVLPFVNDSPNDSTTYFMDGVMEEILTNLQTVKDLRVLSRTSTDQYKGPNKPTIPEIAKKLGVKYIVEGSGQKYGNKFRLRVQLIKATKESHLWAKSYEQELNGVKDIFNIQGEIAKAIATQLEAVITTKEKKLIEKIPTENLEAYKAYLKGRFYMLKFTANDLDTALHYFNLAKEIDPGYALAYAGICLVWQDLQQDGVIPPAEAIPNETAAIMKALELDSTNAVVQYTLAAWRTWGLWDWKGGESAFKKAIVLNPNDGLTHADYSNLLDILGRPKEAMEQMDIALKLDPMNAFIITLYGIHLFAVRRYDESIKACQDAIKIEPGNPMPMTMWILGINLHMKGKYKDALECYKSGCTGDAEMVKALEQGYIEGGYKGAMISYNKLAELRSKTSYWSPWDIATTYALAGENDKAIKWLQKAFEVHDPSLSCFFLPIFDNLREDQRFQELAKKMNLPYK